MSSSSPHSAGTDLIGLLRDNDMSPPSSNDDRPASRRSSLDSLHCLSAFLPEVDDNELLNAVDDMGMFGDSFLAPIARQDLSDPLLSMPMMTLDDQQHQQHDERFVPSYDTTTPTTFNDSKRARRASIDTFATFHKMMASAEAEDTHDAVFDSISHSSASTSFTGSMSMSSFATVFESPPLALTTSPTAPFKQLGISKSFAESMAKSTQSREQLDILQREVMMQGTGADNKITAASISRKLNPETVTSTVQFLTGKRPTLTKALEESRKRLKAYQGMLSNSC